MAEVFGFLIGAWLCWRFASWLFGPSRPKASPAPAPVVNIYIVGGQVTGGTDGPGEPVAVPEVVSGGNVVRFPAVRR